MNIDDIKSELMVRIEKSANPREVLRANELKNLYSEIPKLPAEERGAFGKKLNELKQELTTAIETREKSLLDGAVVAAIDVTAPMDVNRPLPGLMTADNGSLHPIMTEMKRMREIAEKIGFDVIEDRQLDDDFHMFGALNFPEGHPARDSFDTFRTEDGFVPPAHTTTMQNRILVAERDKLLNGGQIATITLGRTFRNEDVDATHEHTFYQWDGVFVSKTATLGQMIATIREFYETFMGQKLKIATQPASFPFTEPSLEFLIERPASMGGKPGEWLEMNGSGMIHPNVLKMAGIDPKIYQGFAWGGGFDRLIMLKYGIEDIRHLESGKLRFLKEFK
ncbi:phenylalanine--tRNA ligase subunit alpha [Candidatus Saccharibacteria bacterium]|nr:phenylalanine--tRNA ligase subunit alpha [Candidatus Saccharibacteria bacterium]MCL1962926.1 phenylalanine--tRNA ligase subunit alpha [Candidatus Saccharibacteria bacterium]